MALRRTDDKLRLGGAYLSELVKIDQDAPLMFEHFAEEEQGQARDYIYEQAAILGVPVRHAEHREV